MGHSILNPDPQIVHILFPVGVLLGDIKKPPTFSVFFFFFFLKSISATITSTLERRSFEIRRVGLAIYLVARPKCAG